MKFIEIKQAIRFGLDKQNTDKWNSLINKHYFGSANVPMDATISDEHKRAAWHVHCGREVNVTMRLYEDGSMEIMPIASSFPVR